ncbi:MAG: GNAT family N-acetyltransferase [Acetobacteraceae bacterium]|nr:GNAT family N-acetyltransferase [Acetobacteraceae bacterium]
MQIALLTEFSPSFLEALDNGLRAHERRLGAGKFIGVSASNDETLIGGLSGWAFVEVFDIRQMWITEAFRGQGIGSEMLSLAENEAVRSGCCLGLVETWSFQAPGFYFRRGYTEFARINDLGPSRDLTRIWVRKALSGGG